MAREPLYVRVFDGENQQRIIASRCFLFLTLLLDHHSCVCRTCVPSLANYCLCPCFRTGGQLMASPPRTCGCDSPSIHLYIFFLRLPTWLSYKDAIVDLHLASLFLTQVNINTCWPCFGGSSRYNFVQGRVRCRLVSGPQLAGKRTLESRGTETTEVEAGLVWIISLFGQFLTFLSLAPQIPP